MRDNDFTKCCIVSDGQKLRVFTDMLCIVPNPDTDFKECLILVSLKVTGLNFKQVSPVHSFIYLKDTVCTMRPRKKSHGSNPSTFPFICYSFPPFYYPTYPSTQPVIILPQMLVVMTMWWFFLAMSTSKWLTQVRRARQ